MEKYIVKDIDGKNHNLFKLPKNSKFNRLNIENIDVEKLVFPEGFVCKYLSYKNVKNLSGEQDLSNIETVAYNQTGLGRVVFNKMPTKKIVFVGVEIFPKILNLSEVPDFLFVDCLFVGTHKIIVKKGTDIKAAGLNGEYISKKIEYIEPLANIYSGMFKTKKTRVL